MVRPSLSMPEACGKPLLLGNSSQLQLHTVRGHEDARDEAWSARQASRYRAERLIVHLSPGKSGASYPIDSLIWSPLESPRVYIRLPEENCQIKIKIEVAQRLAWWAHNPQVSCSIQLFDRLL